MLIDRAVGCLIGSAYGDSLGGAVEFMSTGSIRASYGEGGITHLDNVFGLPPGSITDDTQMAIATADGIIDAGTHLCDLDKVTFAIWQSYLRWLDTQSQPDQSRAPGNTCLSALQTGRMGTINKPLNGSAGCGAIMRAHPAGLCTTSNGLAFELGQASGAITHGGVNGYAPAGFLAALVSRLMAGTSLYTALSETIEQMMSQSIFSIGILERAFVAPREGDLAAVIDNEVGGGGGWRGHDALAISLYAVLCAIDDPLLAVQIAVNHSGDSDSTGAITGAIMGAAYGVGAFDDALKQQSVVLEHDQYLRYLAEGLVSIREGG